MSDYEKILQAIKLKNYLVLFENNVGSNSDFCIILYSDHGYRRQAGIEKKADPNSEYSEEYFYADFDLIQSPIR